jgi:hypothetical protein
MYDKKHHSLGPWHVAKLHQDRSGLVVYIQCLEEANTTCWGWRWKLEQYIISIPLKPTNMLDSIWPRSHCKFCLPSIVYKMGIICSIHSLMTSQPRVSSHSFIYGLQRYLQLKLLLLAPYLESNVSVSSNMASCLIISPDFAPTVRTWKVVVHHNELWYLSSSVKLYVYSHFLEMAG